MSGLLLSMTAFGTGVAADQETIANVEIRSVNNRYLKVSSRLPEILNRYESDIEKRVRTAIARGTVNVNVRLQRVSGLGDVQFNEDALAAYWQHLQNCSQKLGVAAASSLAELVLLPGVTGDEWTTPSEERIQSVWELASSAIDHALTGFAQFRQTEGESMTVQLRQHVTEVESELQQVMARAPLVVSTFRDRISERVQKLVADYGVTVTPADLIREVAIFADRCDFSEETSRLASHLSQVQECFSSRESQGRRLDFLCQELFREINTIGSKANDSQITHHVVTMKVVVERFRELVQNVE